MLKMLRRLHKDERGITGLETAIILIAFVVVASVFSYVVLSAGFLAADQAKGTIIEGLEKTQATLEVRGSVVGNDVNGDGDIDNIEFVVACAITGQSIDISATSTTITYWDPDDKLHVAYDATNAYNPITPVYPPAAAAAEWGKYLLLDEGATGVLDAQDQMSICVGISTADGTTDYATLGANTTFSIEIRPPRGGVLVIERTTPAAITEVTDLH